MVQYNTMIYILRLLIIVPFLLPASVHSQSDSENTSLVTPGIYTLHSVKLQPYPVRSELTIRRFGTMQVVHPDIPPPTGRRPIM